VTLSEGYRNGGANPVAPCPTSIPAGFACGLPNEINVAPDTTTNLEVGLHSQWNGGKLVFNAALYHIDWDKVQTYGVTVNGALPITVNGGKAESKGFEVSLQSRGEFWSFTGSYSHNNAKLTSFAAGIVDGVEDGQPGDRLPGTPEEQASFYAGYHRPIRNGWEVNAGYGLSYSGNIITKVGLRNNGETLGGYAVHSLSAGLSHSRWSANLYIDNLTDKFAETGVRLDPSRIRTVNGFDLRRYYRDVLRPRSIGIEFRYRI
jgi:outer membrane receptor protein involved in Fe transport